MFLFFVLFLQTDTPEEMNGWIKDISSKIQDFRGPSKVMYTQCFYSSKSKISLIVTKNNNNSQKVVFI